MDITGSGGGSEEDVNQDVGEEESSIITREIHKVEVRWTMISTMGGDEMGKV